MYVCEDDLRRCVRHSAAPVSILIVDYRCPRVLRSKVMVDFGARWWMGNEAIMGLGMDYGMIRGHGHYSGMAS